MPRLPERRLPLRRTAVRSSALQRLALFFAIFGPGVITGIVDDDATGITGYSLAGAHYGYVLIWALIPVCVALIVSQEMGARMGVVTGKGLADLIRERFGVRITLLAMVTLLIANAATTIAEFAGVAAAADLFGISRFILVPIAALVVFAVVSFGTYRKVELVLLAVSMVSLSYVVTGFVAQPHWGDVAQGAFVPKVHLTLPFLTLLIGLIGTTITPWQQFYVQSAMVDKGLSERDLKRARADVGVGSTLTNVIAFFIILTTAATLHVTGKPAETVTDIGQALQPLAGDFAARLFAIALLNASLMAMAILPLSTAYAICEAFGWERSVNRPVREAPIFFSLFGGLLVIGAAAVLIPGLPLLFLLFLPNVVGAILLPIILVLTLRLVNDRQVMGRFVNNRLQNVLAWATAVVLVVLTVAYAVLAIVEVIH
jgi:Mn2+/Fe2+ NRAMP family transporter